MPKTQIVFFREVNGTVPLVEWLDRLQARAAERCVARLASLSEFGHELRRPSSAHLGGGIFELRIKVRGLNLRILYFFHSTTAIVVSHGFVKQRADVPDRELNRAMANRQKFAVRPNIHASHGRI